MQLFSEIKETALPLLVQYGLNVLGAITILIIGWLLAKWLSRRTENYLAESKHIDATLTPIIAEAVKILVLTIIVIMVFHQFGLKTTSLVAIIGSIGIGIGLALQGTLSNVASGIMLLIIRPFNAGDAVNLNGSIGVVEKIGLFITELHTYNGVYMTLPNSEVWGNKIQNYTHKATRRIDLTFRIHRDEDMDKAMKVIQEVVDRDERILAEPESLIAIRSLSESSIDILVRPWTLTGDWWQTQLDLNKRIKERFDEENITIPFPQRDVHFSDQLNGENAPDKEMPK